MNRAVAVLIFALLVTAVAVPAAAQSLDDVVREIEAVYGRMTDLRADFTQTAFNKSLNQTIPRLILSIDPKSWEIRKAVVHDQFENTVTMRFSKMVVNSGLPERTFTFVAPKGVVIVPLK